MANEETAARDNYLPLIACIALCCLGPLSGLAQSALSPVMPQISAHFAAEPNAGMMVRLMVSGLSAAMIAGALLSGFLSEKVGQLRLLMVCLVLFALSGAAGFLLDDLYAIVASRIVLGIVNAAAGVLAMALITTRVAPEARDKWLGFYIVAGTIGTVVFMMIVGGLAQIGWRYAFLVYLVALPTALFIAATFRAAPQAEPAADSGEETPGSDTGRGIPWGKVLFGLLGGAVGTTTFMYLPFHLAAIGEGAPERVATVMIVSTTMGGIASFAYGWVRKALSTIQVFVGFFALAGLGLFLIALAQSLPLVLAGVALFGTGFGVIVPNLFAACAAATLPEYRPRMLGFVRAGFYAGPLVAQVLLEALMRQWSAAVAVAGIGALCLLALGLTLAMRRTFDPVG